MVIIIKVFNECTFNWNIFIIYYIAANKRFVYRCVNAYIVAKNLKMQACGNTNVIKFIFKWWILLRGGDFKTAYLGIQVTEFYIMLFFYLSQDIF